MEMEIECEYERLSKRAGIVEQVHAKWKEHHDRGGTHRPRPATRNDASPRASLLSLRHYWRLAVHGPMFDFQESHDDPRRMCGSSKLYERM